MNNKVSIVVPIYNMGMTIKSCLESIFNQDYKNLEVILVDDGSTDNSLEICNTLALERENIKVYHTENRGAGPARNYGISKATGDFIYFPDADDFIEPQAISKLVEVANTTKCDLVVFGYKNVNKAGKTIRTKEYPLIELNGNEVRAEYKPYISMFSPLGIQGAPWNKFFSLHIIKSNNILFPPLRRHQDEGFIGRYMCFCEKVVFIPDILYTYYINDLALEWKKYPVNYIDSVIGLYEVRKSTLLLWNNDDIETHDLVTKEFLCNTIKALELSFSPKMNLNAKQRKEWIRQATFKSGINNIQAPSILGMYHKLIHKLVKRNSFTIVYCLLLLKIRLEFLIRK